MSTTTITLCRQFAQHCQRQTARCITTTRALQKETIQSPTETEAAAHKEEKKKEELLPDEKLQKKLAELELPLKSSSRSIGDSHSILIDAIEAFRPRREIITEKQLIDTKEKLQKSFRLDQLNQYLNANDIPKVKSRLKAQVLNVIFDKIWNIKTEEALLREKQAKLKDRLKKSIPASKQELFFIIGDRGNTIREIEEKYDVKITIDVEQSLYIIEGPTKAVEAAEKETLSHKILQDELDLPIGLSDNTALKVDITNAFSDISQLAKTYIAFDPKSPKKILLSSFEAESIANAKRLLNLMLTELDQNGKASLERSNEIFVRKPSEFTVIPFSDTGAMTFYDEASNWGRLLYNNDKQDNNSNQDEEYQFLDGVKLNSLEQIKETLLTPFKVDRLETVSLEARFGHLLFKNDAQKFNFLSLADIFHNHRNLFLSAMPPFSLLQALMPSTHNYHERTIQAEYVDQSMIISSEGQQLRTPDIKRLLVEFSVNNNGRLELKNIIGEKDRSVVDILNVEGNVDVRLVAKESIDYAQSNSLDAKLEELTSRCELTRSNEMKAPLDFQFSSDSRMILNDITYTMMKNYTYNNHIINFNRVEQQDKKVKRSELILRSKDPKTSLSNPTDKWPGFWKAFTDLASQWSYHNKLF